MMEVVIEEMVTETAEEATRAAPAAPSPAGGGSDEPDIDKLDYQMARRRHRAVRLWAD
jgi:hypothetical protein